MDLLCHGRPTRADAHYDGMRAETEMLFNKRQQEMLLVSDGKPAMVGPINTIATMGNIDWDDRIGLQATE